MGNSVFFRHVPQGEVCKSDSHLSSAQLAAAACKGWHNDDVRWCMQLAWQRQKLTLINAITLAGSEHALTAVTLEMAKASELSTAQLLAQPRSFLKLNFVFFLALESTYFRLLKWIVLEFVMEAQLHSYIWFQSRIFKSILQIMTYILLQWLTIGAINNQCNLVLKIFIANSLLLYYILNYKI